MMIDPKYAGDTDAINLQLLSSSPGVKTAKNW